LQVENIEGQLAEAKADLKQALKDNRVLMAYIRTKEEKAWKQREAEKAQKLREAVEEARNVTSHP
jgi:hypothetical protein